MSCTYRDQLLEARDTLGQRLQETAECDNPEFMKKICDQIKCIQDLLKDVPDKDGDNNQNFDITTRAACY